jgi:hypothetical protein
MEPADVRRNEASIGGADNAATVLIKNTAPRPATFGANWTQLLSASEPARTFRQARANGRSWPLPDRQLSAVKNRKRTFE